MLVLVFTLSLLAVTPGRSEAQEGSWKIEPRTLPVSADVSNVMREALLEPPVMDVQTAKESAPKTAEEWEEFAEQGNVVAAAAAQALAEALSVTIQDDMMGGVSIHRVTPAEIEDEHKNHLFVYIHGGAWVRNGGVAGTLEAVLIAAHLQMPVISIDYRMPPSHPAPAAIDDVVAVWKELLKERSPASIAIGGTSGGGNITLGSVHRFRDLQLAAPGVVYVGTPCVDIDLIGDSRFINEGVDRNLMSWEGVPLDAGAMYAGALDHKDPHISPIYGDFASFPPTYIISGTRDLLLSDAVRLHRKLRRAGVEADLHIYEGQSHGDYIAMWNAPESAEHYAELNAFLRKQLQSPLVPEAMPSTESSKDIKVPKSVAY
jgi:acetyl esterase/lipase